MNAEILQGEAHLLEIYRTPRGVRVGLCPIRASVMATLTGYEELEVDHAELARLVYELRVQLGRANVRGEVDRACAEEIRKLGHLLFDELLPPATKRWLLERTEGELLIRTDEALLDIPWELLHTGRSHLAMQMNIGRLVHTSGAGVRVKPRQCQAPYTALVLADPCGDLEAAYDEGICLRDLLDGQPYIRVALKSSEVSRAFLRENVRECDILHFAGHAELDGGGEGWLLSDGRFTCEDIDRLTGGRPFPSLVFANACGSGRSAHPVDGKPQWSLVRTLLGAGVRHFIGTHWDVPDVIASDFAEHFYRGLCGGMSVGSAMRRARVAVNESHGEGAILWGSYCLYGDPSFVYFPEAVVEQEEADELLVLEPAPETARGVYHTLDAAAEGGRAAQPGDGLGLNPSLRNEALVAVPSPWGAGVRDLTTTLVVTAVVVSGLLLAALGHQLWKIYEVEEVSSSAPAAFDTGEAPGGNAEVEMPAVVTRIREKEEAALKASPKVQFHVLGQTRTSKDDVVEVEVNEGTRLRSGDNIRVGVHPDRDVYAALIMIDGRNMPQLLFPHPSVRTVNGDHFPAGTQVELPGQSLWYRLDKNPGVETLLLVASRQPLENLEGFVAGLEEMASPRTRLKGSGGGVTIRGVGSVTKKKRSGRARRDENAIRTKALTRIQSLARSMDIEIVQSVTYIHMR